MLSQLKWSLRPPPSNSVTRLIPHLRPSFISALHTAAAPGESQRARVITTRLPGFHYCRPDWPKSAFLLAPAAAALSCGRCWGCMTRYSRTRCSFSHLLSDNLVIPLSATYHSTAGGFEGRTEGGEGRKGRNCSLGRSVDPVNTLNPCLRRAAWQTRSMPY